VAPGLKTPSALKWFSFYCTAVIGVSLLGMLIGLGMLLCLLTMRMTIAGAAFSTCW
jgi:hypothetical protein